MKQVQSFLGLAGYFWKFIQHFSLFTKPLSDLTKQNIKFVFGINKQMAFENLKEHLCKEPILKLFNQA